jgi:hypothetical protein
MSRQITNQDIYKYKPMVEKFLRDSVLRNWSEGVLKTANYDMSLGNTGMSIDDFRQYLMTELVVGLQKYKPDFKTEEDRSVKESTFIYCHLSNRIGQLLKKLTKRRFGYAIWMSNLDEILEGHRNDEY